MKKLLYPTACLLILLSCSKDPKVDPNDIKLQKVENRQGTTAYGILFGYDAQGRINSISNYTDAMPATEIFSISYTGSGILIVPVDIHNTALDSHTEISFLVDAEGHALRRIEIGVSNFKAPANNPQWTYINDTTIYNYSVAGTLSQTSSHRWDSTWFNPGTISITKSLINAETIYNVVNGNLVSYNRNFLQTSSTQQAGNPVPFESAWSRVETVSFGYTKNFPNKTDFTNALILNELNLFLNINIDRKYANLPDKISFSSVTKDQGGAVIGTANSVSDATLAYNEYGFLSSASYSSPATGSYNFIYNR